MGQSHYKIGWPYVKKEEKCDDNCGCIIRCFKCKDRFCCCCCCCQEKVTKVEINDKRIYIDIFNMLDQSVGKFAYLFEKGCCCCSSDKLFYEIYFPPDANEMVRLALIGQIIFFHKLRATGNYDFSFSSGKQR